MFHCLLSYPGKTILKISSQYVFDYQKRMIYPEQYRNGSGRLNILLPDIVGKGYGTFWRFRGRYRVVKGSRASKKSKTTALWFITNMMKYPDANALVVGKHLFEIPFPNGRRAPAQETAGKRDMVDALRLRSCQEIHVAICKRMEDFLAAPICEIVVVGEAAVEVAADAERAASVGQPAHVCHLL